MVVTDTETSRADLMEYVGHLCHTAKRTPAIIGTDEYPTPWDSIHADIDQALDLLLGMPA